MIGIPLGLLYSNAFEWFMHQQLHASGRKKKGLWRFHFHEHHKASRKHNMIDDDYHQRPFRALDAQTKEALGLLFGAAVHAPLFPVAPFFVGTVWFSALRYYHLHKKAHLNPEWAREHLPWHVDHHMGRDQEKNWCVTHPFFDYIMGTREDYVGTDAEREDIARHARNRRAAQPTTAQRAEEQRAEEQPAAEQAAVTNGETHLAA